MKFQLSLLAIALAVTTSAVAQDHYQVLRKQAQLWSGPHDDMRPEIEGDVLRVDAGGVMLAGDAYVPVAGSKVKPGQHATFICSAITDGDRPTMRDCSLEKVQAPESSRKDAGKLW